MGYVLGLAGVDFEPGEELAGVDAAGALERGDEDYVPLEALGFVDGHEVYGAGVGGGGGVELGELVGEGFEMEGAGLVFERFEELEIAVGVGEGFGRKDERGGEGLPGALY